MIIIKFKIYFNSIYFNCRWKYPHKVCIQNLMHLVWDLPLSSSAPQKFVYESTSFLLFLYFDVLSIGRTSVNIKSILNATKCWSLLEGWAKKFCQVQDLNPEFTFCNSTSDHINPLLWLRQILNLTIEWQSEVFLPFSEKQC